MDDNPTNLEIISETLSSTCDVQGVASGDEALVVARAWVPDIVLLDIMMPGLNGYETCRRMRADPEIRPCQILLVSAKAMLGERLHGYEVGADDYLVKPFDPAELLAKIRVFARLRRAEELDQMKTGILTLLAHESRTPLAVLHGALESIVEGGTADPKYRDMLEAARASSRRLLDMLEKSTLLVELRSSNQQLAMDRVELGLLIDDAVRECQQAAVLLDVSLEIDVDERFEVQGDICSLQRVLRSLLENAVEHSPSGGRVRISAQRTPQGVRVGVSDQGPGISANLLPTLFETFAVRDIRHHRKGHGLSLALAREIVKQHAGRLSVHSGAGIETEFELFLPIDRTADDSGNAEGLARAA